MDSTIKSMSAVYSGFVEDRQANADRIIDMFQAFMEQNKDEIIALNIFTTCATRVARSCLRSCALCMGS